eukprot:SAG31_NODE_606_length_13607_cov_17.509846_9_plen_134_part_00
MFVPTFAQISAPLVALTKADASVTPTDCSAHASSKRFSYDLTITKFKFRSAIHAFSDHGTKFSITFTEIFTCTSYWEFSRYAAAPAPPVARRLQLAGALIDSRDHRQAGSGFKLGLDCLRDRAGQAWSRTVAK